MVQKDVRKELAAVPDQIQDRQGDRRHKLRISRYRVLPLSTERTTSCQIFPTHERHFISSLFPRTFTTCCTVSLPCYNISFSHIRFFLVLHLDYCHENFCMPIVKSVLTVSGRKPSLSISIFPTSSLLLFFV